MLKWIRRAQSEDGFTLVEVLLVIIIIGILIGIAVFGIATFRSQAELACTNANDRTRSTAVAAYRANFGTGTNPSDAELTAAGYYERDPSC